MPSVAGNATIGIIGVGNMGQALLRGLRAAGVAGSRLLVAEADAAKRRQAARRFGARAVELEALASRAQVVIVAVKPQDLKPVLQQLRGIRPKGRRLVISIAAGVKLSAIERSLGRLPRGSRSPLGSASLGRSAVVRVMPNLPAKIGAGVSAIAGGRFAGKQDLATARAIFGCVGEVVELPERLFDVVTAISGSGPAYFFLIFKALRDAGVRAGMPAEAAQRLAVHTGLGSARLVQELGEDLDRLISQVASKKGTTEAALKVLRRRRLEETLQQAVAAAAKRSKELSW